MSGNGALALFKTYGYNYKYTIRMENRTSGGYRNKFIRSVV